MKVKSRQDKRRRRHLRVRRRVTGTAERPRMCVYVSNRNMYVQFVNDLDSRTLATVSTLKEAKSNIEAAKALGRLAAQRAGEQGIASVVFDRGGFRYGGRVKALAESAREAGLKF
ncbi:MAG: 50S ribosomal protein L18 [Kiritimatiellae bacterium]|nr:50S ribosomal protein L18 [Kiritimatiellia bacterium]